MLFNPGNFSALFLIELLEPPWLIGKLEVRRFGGIAYSGSWTSTTSTSTAWVSPVSILRTDMCSASNINAWSKQLHFGVFWF